MQQGESTVAAPGEPQLAPEQAQGAPARAALRRRRRMTGELVALGLVGVLLVGAIGAGAASLYRLYYSPGAFVMRYLDLLADGRAVDALALPGVAVESTTLTAAGLPGTASEALLRGAALAPLDDARIVSEEADGDETVVTAAYTAGGHDGTTTFRVARDGSVGLAPTWRFAQSPLAVVDLTLRGSMSFAVNGFEIDRRQVPTGDTDGDGSDPIELLVLSPGLYSVSVDTGISTSPGVAILSDAPMKRVSVDVEAAATEEFAEVVQQRIEEFLTACAQQQVLQPTGCPFGFVVRNRVEGLPTWSIVQQPTVALVAEGGDWRIPDTAATAHIDVEVRSLYDGSLTEVSVDVPFVVNATISVRPDRSVSILVGGSTIS